jgi:heterodisulfide reductase subunit A
MMDAGRHPNITLLSYSEVEKVSGYVGNFQVQVRRKPRYVLEDKCTGCGDCAAVCPVQVLSEFDEGLGTRKAIYRPFGQAIPPVFVIDKRDSPCKIACPAHIPVQGYVALVREGKFQEALDLVRETVPFAGTLGRICYHPCETVCKRQEVDQPLAICALKRFVYDACSGGELPEPAERVYQEQVAIVGAGPAGLTAAYHLARTGYGVTVYEALPVAGGMLAVGIPEYRLPRDVLNHEIDLIHALGAEIRLGTPVGRDGGPSLDDLRRENDAVFLAVGAHQSRRLDIPGEDLEGVIHSTDFLRRLGLGEEVALGKRVAVIGGGNAAIDAARSTLRLGSEVTVVYRRSRAEMPAIPAEVEAAMEEGVQFHFLATPTRVLEQDGYVVGMECIRMELGEPDESGRRRPVPIPGSEFTLELDTVIVSIGQRPDLAPLAGAETTRWRTLAADQNTLATPVEGVFAGGDAVTGPAMAIDAMAAGKRAAETIHRYLRGQDLLVGRTFEWPRPEEIEVAIPRDVELAERAEMAHLPLAERRTTFHEVELGLTEEQAIAEAQRCLSCAVCSECLECVRACQAQAIDHQMREQWLELDVGAIVVATGFEMWDPKQLPQYSYGLSPNIITGLQFERLTSAGGPTAGEILTAEGKKPERVAFIHCVGSRDEHAHPYCSRFCCMYSLKQAHQVRDKTGAEVYDFYMDMRAFGKAYEEFYERVQEEGVTFIRGRGAEVEVLPDGKLRVKGEDADLGKLVAADVDMVILASAIEPVHDASRVTALFGLGRTPDGWFAEAHPKLRPVETSTAGVFLAGCCQGPRDVPDTVAHAGAAALEAVGLFNRGEVTISPTVAVVDSVLCVGCGDCIPACPYTAISRDGDGKAEVNAALCQGCGTCAATCPAGAITALHFTNQEIVAQIDGLLALVV